MKTKVGLAILLAATAASAQAQIGFRADVHAGWDGRSTHQHTDIGTNGTTTRLRQDGVVYGGEFGFDTSLAGFILGAYAGIDGATTRQCSEVSTEIETCSKSGRNLTAGLRAGMAVAPRVMLYAKGGYSNGQIMAELVDHTIPSSRILERENIDGWHAGAGLQVSLLAKVYAKLEYIHSDYKDYRVVTDTAIITGGMDRDNVIFGVGVAF